MNRIIALVVAIVVVAFIASSTVFVVDPRHAVVLSARDGAAPSLVGPGLHVKLPPPLQMATAIDIPMRSSTTAKRAARRATPRTGLPPR